MRLSWVFEILEKLLALILILTLSDDSLRVVLDFFYSDACSSAGSVWAVKAWWFGSIDKLITMDCFSNL